MQIRNKKLTCFLIVMFITLIACSIVAASDNATNSKTSTHTKEVQVHKTIQKTAKTQVKTTVQSVKSSKQSLNKTIEETDDQNAVKNKTENAKANIKKVSNQTKAVKTATTVITGNQITGQRSGDFELGADIDLGSGTNKINITGTFTLDGKGYSITRSGSGPAITTKGGVNGITIKNVVFNDLTGTVAMLFNGCTNVVLENCTFNNCPKSEGIIHFVTSDAVIKDCSFTGSIYPLVYSNNYANVSFCQVYYNGEELDAGDFSSTRNSYVFTSSHASSVLLYMDTFNLKVGETANLNIYLAEQMSQSGYGPFTYLNGPVSYEIFNSNGDSLQDGAGSTDGNTGYPFTYTFDKKGLYTIPYSFAGTSTYKAIDGTKIIRVEEGSILTPQVVSIQNDQATVRVNLTNSTETPIAGAPITITYNGNTYTGTTGDDGIVEIVVQGLTQGQVNQVTVEYAGDDSTFIQGSTYDLPIDLSIKNTHVETTQTLSGFTGSQVSITATVKDDYGDPVTTGSVVFKIGDNVLDTIEVTNGVAEYTYTIDTNDVVTITSLYTDSSAEFEQSSNTTTVNRLTIPTNLTITNIPSDIKVKEEFSFKAKLTNRTGDNVEGQSVTVYVNGNAVKTGTTDANGELSVSYTPANNNAISIYAVYTTDNIYLSNTTDTVTIPSSSISLIDPVFNLDTTRNASIGVEYVVHVNLTDGDELVDASGVTVSVDGNLASTEHHEYDPDTKIITITFTPTEVTTYHFTLNYPGQTGVYNSAQKSFTVGVNKIPTVTRVDYAELDEQCIRLKVYFTDEDGNLIHEGSFHLNMNNSEEERQDYDLSNLNDPSYKWAISEDANGHYIIELDTKFYKDNGIPYAYVTYDGSDNYEKSTGYKGNMSVLYYMNINLGLFEDVAHTNMKNIFYVNESVYLFGDLLNDLGYKQNGRINIVIYNDKYPDPIHNISTASSNVDGFEYTFKNPTAGQYTVTVYYNGSGAYYPGSTTRTFTLLKHESSTVARVINNTVGNVTLGVKVSNLINQPIRKGNLTVEVNGIPKVVEFNLPDEEDEVIVSLNDIGLGIITTSEVPIAITYQGDLIYSASDAYDQATIGEGLTPELLTSITAEKGITNITVTVNPETVVIGNRFDVYGYIKDLDGTPVVTDNVNITIINPDGTIKSSQNVSSITNGLFTKNFLAAPGEYEAGEYTVSVSYYDDNHNIVNVEQTFTVRKETANVVATLENATVGNITVRVKVTDEKGDPITEGKVNITDSEGNILYKDAIVNENGEALLVIDSINSNANNYNFVVNYNGTDKYAPASTTDGITNVELTTRKLTILAALENETYGNTSVKVVLKDSATGQSLPDRDFTILLNGVQIGTGRTGSDGTTVVEADIPIGNQAITISYVDDEEYASTTKGFLVQVKQRESKINATLVNNTAGNVTVRVNATDATTGNPITSGTIVVTDNGEEVARYSYENIANGIVDVTTNITDSGDHVLVATLLESTIYTESTYTDESLANVVVDKRNATVSFVPVNSTIGNTTVQVTVTDQDGTTPVVGGTVNVYSDENRQNLIGTTTTDENGVAVIDIEAAVGTTKVYVEYAGNTTYNANVTEQDISLVKRESKVNASLVNTTAGNVTVRVNVTDATTGQPITEGTIVVKDKNGNVVATVPITENPGYIDVLTSLTASGDNKLTVEYEGTDVYADATFLDEDNTLTFTIAKRNASVAYEVTNATFNDTVIKVTIVDEDGVTPIVNGEVKVFINGVETPVGTNATDVNGVTYIKLENLPVDTTNIVVNYTGNTTYNENVTTQAINILPREVNVNASVINKTAGNVTVKVNITDASTGLPVHSGIVNITDIAGNVVSIDLATAVFEEDGTVLIYDTQVDEIGRNKLTVTYDGAPYYEDDYYNIAAFDIEAKESKLTAEVPIPVKGNTTVNVTLTDPVTGEKLNGKIYVSVNGGDAVAVNVVDGIAGLPVDMNVGTNTVNVTFKGDEKYNATSIEFDVLISAREAVITAEFTNETQGNVTLKITAKDDETGEAITGKVNVTLPNGDNVTVDVIDGEASVVLDIPMNGENPQEISITYLSDDTYPEKDCGTQQVTVQKRESSVTAEPATTVAGNTSVRVTVTDPVTGQPITSGTIVITDNGVEVARVDFNEETGIVDVLTNIATSGTHELNVTFLGNVNYTSSNYTDDTLSSISIANRTAIMDISTVNSTVGNTTIEVTLLDSVTKNALVDGVIEVYDGTTLVGTGTIGENGKTNITLTIPVDTTSVTVKYVGNESNYDPLEKAYDLSLEQRESKINATLVNSTAGNVTVRVNATDATTKEPITSGTIVITDNGVEVARVSYEDVANGIVDVTTSITDSGNHNLVVTLLESANYKESTYTDESLANVVVDKRNATVSYQPVNSTVGNTSIQVTLTDQDGTTPIVDGIINVYIEGDTENIVGTATTNSEGVAVINLDVPITTENIVVKYVGNSTYNENVTTQTLSMKQRESSIAAGATPVVAGNTSVVVTLIDATTGNPITSGTIVIYDNEVEVANVDFNEATGIVSVPTSINASGNHNLKVVFKGNVNYTENTYTDADLSNTLISNRTAVMDIVTLNDTVGNTTIEVTLTDSVTGETLPEGGEIEVYGGTTRIGTGTIDANGKTTITFDVPINTDQVTVKYLGNETSYDPLEETYALTLKQRESNVTAEVINATAGNITVKVNVTDLTTGEGLTNGIVNITLNGVVVGTANLSTDLLADGTVEIHTNIQNTGNYVLVAKYLGDENHTAASYNIEAFDATSKGSSIIADITNTTKGNTTLDVTFTDPVTGDLLNGTVYVSVNGAQPGIPVVIENGKPKDETLLDLPLGDSHIVVSFDGDKKYDATSFEFDVTVDPRDITVTADFTNKTQGNITVEVHVTDDTTGEGITGTVNVTLPNGTNVTVDVVDGVGSAVLDIPITDSGKTITVTYPEDGVNKETTITTETLTIEKRNSTVQAEVTSTVANKTEVTVTVTDSVTGKPVTSGYVNVTLDGNVIGRMEVGPDGTVVVPVDLSKKGTYSLVANFEGNENFTNSSKDLGNIVIEGSASEFITEVVNATQGNVTIKVNLTDPVTGEEIPITAVNVTLPGSSEPVEVPIVDGKITVPLDVGDNEITISYPGDNTYNETSTTLNFNVAQRESNVTAEVINATAGNITVKVNVTDLTTGEGLTNGIVNITLNGVVVGTANLSTDLLADGTVEIHTNIQNTGNYILVAKYSGDENHTVASYNIEAFDATPKGSNITAKITNTTKGNTTLDVTFTDPVTGDLLNGTVYVSVNGAQPGIPVVIENGKPKDETLLDLPLGDSHIVVSFDGDKKYDATSFEFDVTVDPRDITVTADFTNKTQGNITVEVHVTDDTTGEGITGTVNVTLPNGTNVTVDVVDGVGSAVLDIPITDSGKTITVTYPEDGVNKETTITTETLTIEKRNSTVQAEVTSTVANKTEVTVTVTDSVTGKPVTSGYVNVTLDGNVIGRMEVGPDGTVVVPVDLPEKGTYSLVANFEGNENFTDSSKDLDNVVIEGSASEFITEVLNTTQGNVTIKVNLTDPVTGEEIPVSSVNVTLPNGEKQEFPVEDGKITVPLDVGDNEITISYPGDNTYNETSTTLNFNVAQRESNVTAEVINTTAGNITVKVNVTDLTTGEGLTNGIVNITLNGEVVGTADLSTDLLADGTVEIHTNIQNTGNYILVAKYSGDENHTVASYNIEAFDATPKGSNITAKITNTTKGNTTLDVTFTDPVTGDLLNGTVYVSVNGAQPGIPVVIENGKPKDETLLDLPLGDSHIVVSFDGDKKYDATSFEFDVTVDPRDITVTADFTNKTQGNITVEVHVTDDTTGEGITGTVNVTLPNGTNVTVDVVDGVGSAVLDIPITDSGKTITVTYPEDGVNKETTITTETLTIEKRESNVTAEVTTKVADKAEVTVTVTDPVTGKPVTSGYVNVTLDGNDIGRMEVGPDGTVVVPVDLPEKGTYNLVVNYEGNENFTSSSTQLDDVEIEGSASEFIIEVANATQGNVTIKVNLTDPVTSEEISVSSVNVTLPNGETQEFPVEDGKIVVPLDVGDNEINISYPGDKTYNATSIPVSIKVTERQSQVDAEVTNTTAGNVTVKVNVTDPVTKQPVTEGYVNITVDGVVVGRAPIESDGTATIVTDITKIGRYTIVANFEGNENYSSNYKTVDTIDVARRDITVTANIPDTTQGDTVVNITAVDSVTKEPINGPVVITLPNGVQVTQELVDGKAQIPVNIPVGDNTIKITYPGDDMFNKTEISIPVNVKPRESEIKVTVKNSTQGNTTVEVTLSDTETGLPIDGDVIVTLPDGTNVTAKAVNGKVIVPVDIPVPGGDVTISYPSDGVHKAGKITIPVKVEPRKSTIKTTISNSTAGNTTVSVVVTDSVTGKPVTSGYVNVTVNGKAAGRAKVNPDGTATIVTNIANSGKYDIVTTYEGNANYTTAKKTDSKVKVATRSADVGVSFNNVTVGKTTMTVTLKDSVTGKAVSGKVDVKLADGKVVTVNVDKSGKATVPVNIPAGSGKVTATFAGNSAYSSNKATGTYKVDKVAVNVAVNPIKAYVGEKVKLVAKVTDASGKKVDGGNLVFKINGKTLRKDGKLDSKAQPLKVNVKNGVATLTVTVTKDFTGAKYIVASYSGTYKYAEGSSDNKVADIKLRTAKTKVTINKALFKQKEVVKIVTKVTDSTGKSQGKKLVNEGYVILKINDQTIKDSKNKAIKFKVVNNKATYSFKIPKGTSGVFANKLTKDYVVTASYINKNYVDRIRNASSYRVQRSDISINFQKVAVKNKRLSVKGVIVDKQGNRVYGVNKVCVKINGHTYTKKGKTVFFKVKEGKIDISKVKYSGKINTITIVTGDRQAYQAAIATTNKIETL